jgi:pentatricopeptide repeat protein
VTYNTLIQAHGNANQVQRAEAVFEEMKREGQKPDKYTYNTLFCMYIKAAERDKAEELFEEMRKGCGPSRFASNNILRLYAKRGETQKVKAVLKEMKGKGYKPDEATSNLLSAMSSKVAQTIKSERPRLGVNYSTLIKMYAKHLREEVNE